MAITNLITNGDFSTGGSNNWGNWVTAGAFAASGANETAPTLIADNSTASATYAGLSGLDSGGGANGAGQVSLDVAWQNAGGGGNASTLEVRVAGVLVATITTSAGAGTSATITYANGASGNLSTLSENSGFEPLTNWIIDLPASIPSSGSLAISMTEPAGASDDFRIDNVAVLVEDPDVDAVDDAATLAESEAGGDVDFNVSGNDANPSGLISAVNGDAANLDTAVAGSNGGLFTVSANGNVDFDANGAFESLGANESAVTTVTYTISDPNPFAAGSQTAQTSATVGQSDQTAFFTFNTGEFSNDGTTGISGSISLSSVTQPIVNVLFVMDVSGSTGFASPTFPGVGDLNGDGDADEVIDAEIAAFRQLSDDIDALGFADTDLQVGLVTFESAGSGDTEIVLEGVGDQSFNAGSLALDNALNVGAVGGGTDFEAALQLAIQWFNGQPTGDVNVIYFLSDGVHNGGTFTDEVTTLANNFNTVNHAVGITASSDLTQLNQIDNTGGAQQVTNLADLNAALQAPFTDADVVDFRIFVDGVEDTSIDLNDLTPTGTGFNINAQTLAGLTQAANSQSVIVAEVDFDNDGDGTADTTLTNTLIVETPTVDTATISVTVTGENDTPDAVDDNVSVDEDTPLTVDVLANDSDPDGDVLTVSSVSDPAGGTTTVNPDGTVTYTPDQDFSGTDTFTYTVTDPSGATDTATVTVTVNPVNDPPVAADDAGNVNSDATTIIDVLANDTDVDGDTLTVTSVQDPAGGTVTINPGGTITYNPNGAFDNLGTGQTAVETFTYTVADASGATDTATVSVTITGVNTPPVAVDDNVTTTNDASAIFNLTANDSDADLDDVEILSVNSTGVQGLVFVGTDDDTIFYDPNGAFDGLTGTETATETLTYTVTDGNGGTDTATVTITITNGNSDPTVVDDTATVDQGDVVTVNVLDNDSDPDGDTLTVSTVSTPTSGTAVINPDGTITYTPDQDFSGPTDSFTYTASDGRGGTATATVTVTVNPNFPPFIPEPVVFFAPENQILAANVPAIDLEFDPIMYSIAGTGVDDALFTINQSTGRLDFLQPPDFENPADFDGNNIYLVDITVADQFGSNTQTISINVVDVDDTPDTPPNIDDVLALNGAFEFPVSGPDPDRVQFFVTNNVSGVIADVEASDLDPGDSLIFSLFGEDAGLFNLNVITGEITLGQPLTDPRGSFDGDAEYELDVLVTDSQGNNDVVEVDITLLTGA